MNWIWTGYLTPFKRFYSVSQIWKTSWSSFCSPWATQVKKMFVKIIFASSHIHTENPEGTQVILCSMNMGSDIYLTLYWDSNLQPASSQAHIDSFRPHWWTEGIGVHTSNRFFIFSTSRPHLRPLEISHIYKFQLLLLCGITTIVFRQCHNNFFVCFSFVSFHSFF